MPATQMQGSRRAEARRSRATWAAVETHRSFGVNSKRHRTRSPTFNKKTEAKPRTSLDGPTDPWPRQKPDGKVSSGGAPLAFQNRCADIPAAMNGSVANEAPAAAQMLHAAAERTQRGSHLCRLRLPRLTLQKGTEDAESHVSTRRRTAALLRRRAAARAAAHGAVLSPPAAPPGQPRERP